MVTVSNGGVTATYTYNALGQRVKRATTTNTTLYSYDEAGHLTGEYTASGALIQETVWMGDIPVGTLRPNGSGGVILFYVHTDQLNTPRIVTDISNNIRWRWDSDAFGKAIPNGNPSGIGLFEFNLRLPGQQYDAVAGLQYNYFRDYDPSIGRYVQSDPIGLKAGLNTYLYSYANVLLWIDPRGLSAMSDYVDCLASQATGSVPNLSCHKRYFASATAESTEDARKKFSQICRATLKGLECTANCTLEEVVGKDIIEFARKVHEKAIEETLKKIAETTANEFVKRGVPVANVLKTIYDLYGIANCTVDCVRK
jgi:RHS repeat-associated protein